MHAGVVHEENLRLPPGVFELGNEIARGSFGAVHMAKVYGESVCAKVRGRRGHVVPVACWVVTVCGSHVRVSDCIA
jgi:hypothetical protein